MATHFHAPNPWEKIKIAAQKTKAYIAVPFLGKGAAAMLPVSPGSVLVTRFTREAVKAGQVDPKEVVKLIRNGVVVFNQPDLHAKLYVFPRRAFVGSANASKTSEGLIEACVETTDKEVIRQTKEFVCSLDSDLVTIEYAKSLLRLYPKDGERYFGIARKTSLERVAEADRFWIVPAHEVEFDAEVRNADRLGSKRAKAKLAKDKSTSLEKLHLEGKIKYVNGDWLLFRAGSGRGYLFECPGRVVHVEPFRTHFGPEAIVYVEYPKRQRLVKSTEIRATHPELVKKLCFNGEEGVRLKSNNDVATVKRLWKAFRA